METIKKGSGFHHYPSDKVTGDLGIRKPDGDDGQSRA